MNALLRLFFIYLVLLGLIYMIPFPYRMTKEGFTANNDLSLSNSLSDTTIKANDQTLYCEDVLCPAGETSVSEVETDSNPAQSSGDDGNPAQSSGDEYVDEDELGMTYSR